MRVRQKVGIYTILTTLAAVATLYFTLSFALQSQFSQLESFTSKRDAGRAVEGVTAEEDRLAETTLDYAAWDDSYNFIANPTQEFIDSNFTHSTLKFDVILYVSSTGTPIYSYTSTAETKKSFSLPALFISGFRSPNSPYRFTDASKSLKGVLMTTEGPLLFAALPITRSDRKGDIRGTILMGKLLTGTELEKVSNIVKIPLSAVMLTSSDASVLPADWKKTVMPSETVYEVPVTPERMQVYSMIPDIYGHPAFALRADLPRLTNIEGQRGLQYLLFALIAMSIVFGAFTVISIERVIVHPIQRLSDVVRDMEKSHVIPDEALVHGNDEITELARTFMRAFGALELSENRLRTDRERLDAILQSIGEGVVVVGKDQNIVLENRMAERLSGFLLSEVIGKPYQKYFLFYNEQDRNEEVDVIGQVLKHGQNTSTAIPMVYSRKDGMSIPVACVSAALRDGSGHLIGSVIVFRDVTKEREVDRMKSELISIASHQLRTPLTGIKWVLELLMSGQSGKLTKDQRDQLEHVSESNERMIALVEDLLNVSHIETGRKFTYVFQRQDFMKIVHAVVEEQQVLAKVKHVSLTISRSSPRVCVSTVDADKIREAITNLVSNAVKYTPKDGHVIVSVEQSNEGETLLHVKDSGIGIPIEQQKRVFERFFRADNAQSQEVNGTGLGLYIAKAIVEGHHGRIWFESQLDKGSTFSFILPERHQGNDQKTS
jgi:PAS domain S-box-containing protein